MKIENPSPEIVANSPIVKIITLSILKKILSIKYEKNLKLTIDSDIIPIVHKQENKKQLIKNTINKKVYIPQVVKDMPITSTHYGKIDILLKDSSISAIECPGPNKELFVFRGGTKQITRITLSKEEIKQLLEIISKKARIPLISGIFRVAIDNFIIHAIVSKIINLKFIIRKDIHYPSLIK